MFNTYYQLTKPGIIYGNVMTATAGFLLAAGGHIEAGRLLAVLLGTALVIASACVFNNYIDRDIDRKMARTKKRALASGQVSERQALVYASLLGIGGSLTLALFTNRVTTLIGLWAFVFYVGLYGIAKRRSVHGTLVGTIPGAAPLVAGYTAVTGSLDKAAFLLFLIMVCWQMAHFYAIAIYRFDDYKAAGLPVMPVKYGIPAAKLQIMLYIVGFVIATSLLTAFGYVSGTFLAITTLLGVGWLGFGLQGYQQLEDKLWARQMFFASLLVLLGLSAMLAIDATFLT